MISLLYNTDINSRNQSPGLNKGLRLYHEAMLLSIRDKEGTFVSNSHVYAVACGIAVELLLLKRLEVSSCRRKYVTVNSTRTGDQLLDDVLALIAKQKCKVTISMVMGLIATGMPKLTERVIEELCDRKILRTETKKRLGIFSWKIYPTTDSKIEKTIRARMAQLMFGQTTRHDRRTTLLIVIAKQMNLLKHNFDNDRLARNKSRIEKIAKGEKFKARASRSAKSSMNSALAVALVVGKVAASAE